MKTFVSQIRPPRWRPVGRLPTRSVRPVARAVAPTLQPTGPRTPRGGPTAPEVCPGARTVGGPTRDGEGAVPVETLPPSVPLQEGPVPRRGYTFQSVVRPVVANGGFLLQ